MCTTANVAPPVGWPALQQRRLGFAVALSVLLAVPAAWVAAGPLGLRLGADGPGRLMLALVLAPLVEELLLRPLLQAGVVQHLQARRWSWPAAQAVAAAATTAAFALSHLDAFTLSAVLRCTAWLLPGAALALAWAWRQRTWHCVLLHAAFNAALWASSTAPLARG